MPFMMKAAVSRVETVSFERTWPARPTGTAPLRLTAGRNS
jgi:hypothetical protein